MTTEGPEPSILERIMLNTGDYGLFPQEVLDAFVDPRRGPLVAYALMKKVAAAEPDDNRRQQLQERLDDLRLWTQWGTKAPGMSTFNGFGVTAWGREDENPNDKSFILTTYLTGLFVPFIPLNSYIVTKASSGWYFHGKCPLTPRARRHRKAVFVGSVIATAVVIAGITGMRIADGRSAEIVAYNAFQRPVELQIDGTSYPVRAQAFARIDHTATQTEVVASFEDGTPIEQLSIDLSDMGRGLAIYNIGNRAVIVESHIVYGRGSVPDDVVFSDQVTNIRGVDYLFRDPPDNKSITGDRDVDKAVLDWTDELTSSEWLAYFFNDGRPEDALEFAMANVIDGPTDMLTLSIAAQGLDAAVDIDRWCERIISQHESAVNRHRYCQEARPDKDAVLAEYTQRAADNPDSATAQYLLGRISEPANATVLFARAMDLDPDFGWAHMAQAHHTATTTNDWTQALSHLDQSVTVEPSLEEHTRDLWLRLSLLNGVPMDDVATGWEARVPEYVSQDVLSVAKALRLTAHPETLGIRTSEIQRELLDEPVEVLANVIANASVTAKDLDGLRDANAQGAGLEMFTALSDGATDADRAWQAPVDNGTFRLTLYGATHEAREGREAQAHFSKVGEYDPAIEQLLRFPPTTMAEASPVVRSLGIEWQAAVWFALYRLTDNTEFREQAQAWALPFELPILND